MAKKKQESDSDEVSSASQDALGTILKGGKEDHYNFVKESKKYTVSTGSLVFDAEIGGGINSGGLIRCVGINEGGKTSASLELMRNYFKTVPKSKGILVLAEGRLAKEMIERSGIKFVWDSDQWEDGTCFVLETNVYDLVVNLMRKLVVDNPEDNRYYFLLDSMDGLILKSDMAKDVTEAGKVAGAPALTKKFLQRLAISMNKMGHTCNMLGQVSAKVQIDPYAPKDKRSIDATGGNAALHFSNWIFQFEQRFNGDIIPENPAAKFDPVKNKAVGHWCKVTIKKSPNEKTNNVIRYPIKYWRKNGNSVWREYEIIDIMTMYELIESKGAWIDIDESIIEAAKEAGIEIPPKHNGRAKFQAFLEENKEATDWLFNKMRETVMSEANNEVSKT